jgi:hypothetical protein
MNVKIISVVLIFFIVSCERQTRINTKILPRLAEATNGILQLGYYVEDLEANNVTVPINLDQMFSVYPETQNLGIKKEEWIYEYKKGVGLRMRSLISYDGYYLERRFDGKVEKIKENHTFPGK